MPTITIRISPRALDNPDADIRYELPDLVVERSEGRMRSDGYDYEDDDVLAIFLATDDLDWAEPFVRQILDAATVLGNQLSGRYLLDVEP